MGKKVKEVQWKEEEEPAKAHSEVKDKGDKLIKKPIEKYLPHDRYMLRRTKQHQRRKDEAIKFIQLDKGQVKKAVVSLKKFINSTKNVKDLFKSDSEGFIYLEVDMGHVPENMSVRPIQIPLPHPIYGSQYNSRFAVFCRDPESEYAEVLANL